MDLAERRTTMDKGKRTGKKWGILAVLVVGALMVSMLAAGPTMAVKGGNGGHRGTGTITPTGICAATPNPATPSTLVTVAGSGFRPFEAIVINAGGYYIWGT